MGFPTTTIPKNPDKVIKTAIAYRQVRAGDTLWIGENGYCYPPLKPNDLTCATQGANALAIQSIATFANGDYFVNVSDGGTNRTFYESFEDGALTTMSPSSYNGGGNAITQSCASVSSTTTSYGLGSGLSATQFQAITRSNGAIGGTNHGIASVGNYYSIAMRPQGDLIIFCTGASTYPTFKVLTTAGVQVIASTVIESSAASGSDAQGCVIPFYDGSFAFFWKNNGTGYVRVAVYDASGTQIVAPANIAAVSQMVANCSSTNGGLLSTGNIFFATDKNAYLVNRTTGALVATSPTLFRGSGAIVLATVIKDTPVVIVRPAESSSTSGVSVAVLDKNTLGIKDGFSAFSSRYNDLAMAYFTDSVKSATGDLIISGTLKGTGTQGAFSKVISMDFLREKYIALTDGSANTLVTLQAV